MRYLADSLDERLDPRRVLPTARSVVSLGCVYNTSAPRSTEVSGPARAAIARYAWGDDYHDVLRGRLRRLLRAMAGAAGPGFEAFSCVDNGPVQERVFAEQAGLGWIGKNSCVINPTLGSWIFLSEILTNAELEPDAPAVDQCGTCTRCLDACPTAAIVGPGEVDATRCLSYLTIELRTAVAGPLRDAIHPQVFGCDICQDVCPWNRGVEKRRVGRELSEHSVPNVSLVDWLTCDGADLVTELDRLYVPRNDPRWLQRNALYALGNTDDGEAIPLVAEWAASHDPILADAAAWATRLIVERLP
jgi:epoxyqueuosine reductase